MEKERKENENYSLGQIPSHHNIILDFFNMKKEKKENKEKQWTKQTHKQ